MGGRGSFSGGGGHDSGNPPDWSNATLARWMHDHPRWVKPEPPGYSDEELDRWIQDHPGWGEPTPPEDIIVTSADRALFRDLKRRVSGVSDVFAQNQMIKDWLERQISDHTVVAHAGPDGIPDNLFYVKGTIPIHFGDPDDPKVIEAIRLLTADALPSTLTDNLKGIILSTISGAGGDLAVYDDGIVTIWADASLTPALLAHELGHALFETKTGQDFQAARDSGEPLPSSGFASVEEDFAECVSMYVTDPNHLKQIAPRRYRVIRQLMRDRGYHG